MKVLITGGKSALALKIAKAFTPHQIILADYGEIPNFSSTAYKFISLGEKNEDTIAHNLLNHCLDEDVDRVLPLHTFEIIAMCKAKVLFSEFNIDTLLPIENALAPHFDIMAGTKFVNWAVFVKGEVVFASFKDDKLFTYAKAAELSGAFYLNESTTVANLQLITI
ncbi:hypothetical protein WG904_12365 [Pedobacter sp. Du54]|uniref:hypothetical protein n=1 Tax=Pedobacter anseongensis TaxID=3133439 RepID=UPI00309B139C